VFAMVRPLPEVPARRSCKARATAPRAATSAMIKAPPRFGFDLLEPDKRETVPKRPSTPRAAKPREQTQAIEARAFDKLAKRFSAIQAVIADPRPAVEVLRHKLAHAKKRPSTDHPSTDDVKKQTAAPKPRLNRAQRRMAKAEARRQAKGKRRSRRDSG
jgi:hypothetical protein